MTDWWLPDTACGDFGRCGYNADAYPIYLSRRWIKGYDLLDDQDALLIN